MTHNFKHDLLIPFRLNRIDSPEGRFYEYKNIGHMDSPFMRFPSVTSVLANYYGTEWLDEWKARVGEEKANRVSTQAKRRGTAMHSIYEKFLLNEDYTKGSMPNNLIEFNKVKPYLEKNITCIRGIELPLCSHYLHLAGTTDAFIYWDNVPTILDFKTSKKPKKAKYIESYFVQATIYSRMIEEMYGIKVPQLVIIMTVDHDDPLIFIEPTSKYYDIVEKVKHANSGSRIPN